jgi:hypothetical protein
MAMHGARLKQLTSRTISTLLCKDPIKLLKGFQNIFAYYVKI